MNRTAHTLSTAALGLALWPFGLVNPDLFLVAGGASLGILLHPDLDQGDTLYGAVRKHRGLSHWPVVGTLDRVLWFLGPVLLALYLVGWTFNWKVLVPLFVGLCLADLLHVLMDRFKI